MNELYFKMFSATTKRIRWNAWFQLWYWSWSLSPHKPRAFPRRMV